jgi:hypothetical protein
MRTRGDRDHLADGRDGEAGADERNHYQDERGGQRLQPGNEPQADCAAYSYYDR